MRLPQGLQPFVVDLERPELRVLMRDTTSQGREKMESPMYTALLDVSRQYAVREGRKVAMDASQLKDQAGQLNPRFKSSAQQDVHEFLVLLLDALEEEVTRRIHHNNQKISLSHSSICPTTSNFEGVIHHTRLCTNRACTSASHAPTPVREIFRGISVNIDKRKPPSGLVGSPPSVEELVIQFFNSGRLQYKCDNCDACESIFYHKLSKLPRVLQVQLKRFNTARGKIREPVRISDWIDLGDACGDNVMLPHVCADLSRHCSPTDPSPKAELVGRGISGEDAVRNLFPPTHHHDGRGCSKSDQNSPSEQVGFDEAVRRSLKQAASVARIATPNDDVTRLTYEEQVQWAMAESTRAAVGLADNSPQSRHLQQNMPALDRQVTPVRRNSGKACYRLVSIIRHTGSSAGHGHYICDVVSPTNPGLWKCYNDSVVTEVTRAEVLRGKIRNVEAYMLFYLHESCLPQPHSSPAAARK